MKMSILLNQMLWKPSWKLSPISNKSNDTKNIKAKSLLCFYGIPVELPSLVNLDRNINFTNINEDKKIMI